MNEMFQQCKFVILGTTDRLKEKLSKGENCSTAKDFSVENILCS